jgi:hypothetical protein
MSTSDRQARVREMGEAMRIFMARAILFQEAVARSAGLNATDRRRVVVTADAAALWRRVGATYARIGQRWEAYLEHLDDDQLTLAIELFTRAAELNHDETVRLRAQVRPQRGEDVP